MSSFEIISMTMIKILPMYLKYNYIEGFLIEVKQHRIHLAAIYEKDTQVFVSEISGLRTPEEYQQDYFKSFRV